MPTDEDAAFEALLEHVKEERGFDFSGYKRASLVRRVRRRMDEVGLGSVEAYHDYVLVHPEELAALFDTILINVTSFFRDADAWNHLRDKLLPELCHRRQGRPIRAWTAGCASGEEAYSLAMLFAEVLGADEFRQRVKIYATDVDEAALVQARQATYPASALEAVPEPLREKYFVAAGAAFAFRQELRRTVIFGRNDLVQDAPISHVDVLTCRNTLMYFNADTQARILHRLHFGLKPDGLLFLGKAEMLLGHSTHFRPLDLRRRFFQKVPGTSREPRSALVERSRVAITEDGQATRLRHAALMSSPAAQVLLDTERRLVMNNSRAMHLFGISPRDIGRPIQDLELSYRPVELRPAIDQAMSERRQVWVRDVTFLRATEDPLSLDIQVLPLSDETGAPLGVTVTFNDVTQYRQLRHDLEFANRELETAYEELQSTNEELETTNEELQSTNEELETTNEELQSTNEELETMNEELQSMNDELQLINETLRDRQDEADHVNAFMSSLLGSMSAGVAVVDPAGQLLAWNARAEDLWGVHADEVVGARFADLDIGLPVDQLQDPIKAQLSDGGKAPETLMLDAVNRRGRPVRVKVTISRVLDHQPEPAAMLVMDLEDDGTG